MTNLFRLYLLPLIAILLMASCNGSSDELSAAQDTGRHMDVVPAHSGDTVYTEERAMEVFTKKPDRALQILDSAESRGNLPDYRASLFRLFF